MKTYSLKFLATAFAAFAMTLVFSNVSHAGWGSWGSFGSRGGSSFGSYGSGGGSYGSFGSRGGRLFGSHGGSRGVLFPRLRGMFRGSHGSGGSYGSHGSHGYRSYGSWGGSHGSYGRSHGSSGGSYGRYSYYGSGSHGSYGSHGSHGSHGGYSYSHQGYSTPQYSTPSYAPSYAPSYPVHEGGVINGGVQDGVILEGPANMMPAPEASDTVPSIDGNTDGQDGNSTSTGRAVLQVSLPVEAKVFVNGKLTQTEGSVRKYVSRNLKEGRKYEYELRAILDDGRALTKIVDLRAGQFKPVKFNFDNVEKITSVTLHVPENAVVTLAGNETKAAGAIRYFSTKSLKPGQIWEDYTVKVSYPVNGRLVTKSRTIKVVGGESHHVRFDDAAVASR